MFLLPVTENEVRKVVKDLKKKSLAGSDEVHVCIVKQCMQLLKKPLTDIYKASLESGIFPDHLKIARVSPLHQKGDKNDIQNYKQIVLLSAFSKL